ncbi:MAG: LptE family protein [Flavobacteriales bacterium]|nr:LptE family protein [Flavobacteriales bacterium]
MPTTGQRRPRLHAILLIMFAVLHGCTVNYGFSGGDVGNAKTMSVDLIEARAPLATPLSAQVLTESVRDLLLAQTPLKLKQNDGDVQYSGALVGYDVQPVSIQANETAALNRLTMTVQVTYLNTLDAKKNKEFTISRFADYDSAQDITSVEERLARDIGKQLAQDIFDRTLGDW